MKKSTQAFMVWLLLCLALSAQAEINSNQFKTYNKIDHNWSELSEAQYVDNLVACELKLQEYKWSKNIWPDANKKPKPAFSEVVEVGRVWEQVLANLKMQSILADRFNTTITDKMLQHDLDRMAHNSKDASGLKALFALFDNNPDTIAQCISRPYLVKQKTQNNYSFNHAIHAETKEIAQTELLNYLKGHDTDDLKAQVNTTTFEIKQEALGKEKALIESDQQGIKLSDGEFSRKIQQLQNNNLQENDYGFFHSEILAQSDDSVKVKTLTWQKASFDLWLQAQSADIYPPLLQKQALNLPTITGSNNLTKLKTAGVGDFWGSGYYAPDSRQNHTAIWSGSEMIIWGGDGTNTGGRYNPATDSWKPTNVGANAPIARRAHTAIWSGSEMIVWGGDGPYGRINTGGRYDPATDSWKATSVGANVPSGRHKHTAIWSGSEMIVWGGDDPSGQINTGGRYDPDTDSWLATSVGANVPNVRRGHTAIWSGGEMIVWGGTDTSLYDDKQLFTGGRYNPSSNSWKATSVAANVPDGRSGHTAIWTGSEMIVWGGRTIYGAIISGGRYKPATNSWKATSVGANVPSLRDLHTAIWSGSEMIVWGGSDSGFNELNTGGRYNPVTNSWLATGVGANVASGRHSHTAIWSGTEMIVWGGINDGGIRGSSTNTGGRYNPSAGSWIASSMDNIPKGRHGHTAIWSGTEMIIWGSNKFTNTGGRYNPATDSWLATGVGANVPSGRRYHTAIWSGSEMIVWGGTDDGYKKLNTGGRYDPLSDSWKATGMSNAPTARYYHTAVWSGTEMIIWGGNQFPVTNTGGRYNPTTGNWSTTSVGANAPSDRFWHTAIWTGSEMIIWGGYRNASTIYSNTGGRYDPVSNTWLATSEGTNVPDARREHTAIWTGSEMIIWGGTASGGYANTVGRYDPDNDNWLATSVSANVPSGRVGHTAIWSGTEMIVWGGLTSGGDTNTGGRYYPDTDNWFASSVGVNVPSARRWHTAIWSGNEMIVWGGSTPLETNSLGLYYLYDIYSDLIFRDGFE